MNEHKSDPLNMEESLDIALKDHNGKVVMLFPRSVPHIVFEPQSAFNVAEELARCAHKARFPSEKLPEDFSPDGGISFELEYNVEWNAKQGKPPQRHEPIGTNLFTATQATEMIEHILGGAVDRRNDGVR